MSITWILQSNLIDQDQVDQIHRAVINADGVVQLVKVIPFCDDVDFIGEPVPSVASCLPYGSTKLTKLGQALGWRHTFFNNSFKTTVWNKERDDMLNQQADVMTVKEATKRFAAVAPEKLYFIRPVNDLKEFNGTVTTAEEIARWMASTESGNFSFTEDTLVSIALPKNIETEWRWFIVDGQVVDGSVYRLRGLRLVKHESDPIVIAEAQRLADIWLPHETCVMDMATVINSRSIEAKVVEFNCFNSSGFYYHNIPKIVQAVHRVYQ